MAIIIDKLSHDENRCGSCQRTCRLAPEQCQCLCNKQQTNRDVDEEEDGPDEVQSQQTVLHEFSVSLDVATIA